MFTISGGGAFTRTNISQINSNFTALTNPDFWVKPQGPNANNSNPGTFESPFADMSGTVQYLKPGVVIGLQGTLFQCWAPPAVNDITIVGMANTPRQATDSGIPNGGGATWLNATHTTTPTAADLVKVGGAATETKVSQAWRFENIFFNNAATGATTACVSLYRGDGSGVDVGRDASHASFVGCKFTGGNYGILDEGGASFVSVDTCEFFNFTGTGDTGIKHGTDTSVALPLQWVVTNNRFWNNDVHISMPFSSAVIANNSFGYIGASVTTTSQIILTSGKNNDLHQNYFEVPFNQSGLSAMFAAGTNDRWIANALGTASLTPMTGFVWGIPVSGAA